MSDSVVDYQISVGIPTKNRPQKLRNCLRSLANQTFKSFRVIIIDGSKDDETRKVCYNFSNDISITYIKDLTPGRSRARKIIAENCESKTLLYIDDDVYLLKDCISELIKHYESLKIKDNYIISGQIQYFGSFTTPIKLTRQGKMTSVPSSEADFFLAALVLIPRAKYKRIPWNERFVNWGFEEVLFFLMCKRHLSNFSFINIPLAIHNDEGQKRDFPVSAETHRTYVMLYKHIFVEPSIRNLVIFEIFGFLGFLRARILMRYPFSLGKLTTSIFSYIHSYVKGHFWFFMDLKFLKRTQTRRIH